MEQRTWSKIENLLAEKGWIELDNQDQTANHDSIDGN